jgi:hypothetical protein
MVLPNIDSLRQRLSLFIQEIGRVEKELFDKASALWELTISSEQELDPIITEIDSLIVSFDGLDSDLEDLLSMKRVIKVFRICFDELNSSQLPRDQFGTVKDELIAKFQSKLEEEEVPWDFEEVFEALYLQVLHDRESRSHNWLATIFADNNSIRQMDAGKANRLLRQLTSPPFYLTKEDGEKVNALKLQVSRHLAELNVEWLIEKFKELPKAKRSEFIKIVNELVDN